MQLTSKNSVRNSGISAIFTVDLCGEKLFVKK